MLPATELFQQLAQALPFGVCIVDLNQKILFWNSRAAEITGYWGHDVIGRLFRDNFLVGCESGPECQCWEQVSPADEAMREGRPAQARAYLQHRSGHRIPVTIEALPLRDEHGRVIAVGEIFREEHLGAEGVCWITESNDKPEPALSIAGFHKSREQLELSLAQHPPDLGVFLIEISDLNDLTRTRGRDIAVVVLRAVAQTVVHTLPMPHFLGAWSRGRLLLLVPGCHEEQLEHVKRKVSAVGSACAITWWGDRVLPHVRVNGTILQPEDSAPTLMSRLEQWPAKAAGAGEN